MITTALLKREANQYDVEVIQRLFLERQDIFTISNLTNCISLVDLSLAWNEITIISGLENLTNLRRLDLSHNKIKKIEKLESLMSLQWLDLSANFIKNIDDIQNLTGLSALKSLCLKGSDLASENATTITNQACLDDRYPSTIYLNLPQVIILDGSLIELIKTTSALQKQFDSIQPRIDNPELLAIETNTSMSCWFSDEASSSLLSSASFVDRENKLKLKLEEECEHLVRKSQNALQKAALPN